MMKQNINGIFLLDKPLDASSNWVLQKVKRLFNAKKAGHTGSLDVLASGMLPICLGEATKFSQYLLDANKTYQTTAVLGKRTTTCDAEGEVIEEKPIPDISTESLEITLQPFRGETLQTPSMYSALKHKGQPLYKLARQGIEVERKQRKIIITQLDVIDFHSPNLVLNVSCSKGTYIRNLIDDIGQAMGCGAFVNKLRRLTVSQFKENDMITLEQLENMTEPQRLARLIPMDMALTSLPQLLFDLSQKQKLMHGLTFADEQHTKPGLYKAYCDDLFLGVVERLPDGIIKAQRLINFQQSHP